MNNNLLNAKALFENSLSNTTLLANASAFIMENFKYLNWVGFYLFDNKNSLLLGPFQGKVACEVIEVGKGVCGSAFLNNETMVVDDVNTFKGHIVCDSNSKSELVIPLIKNNVKIGVLDIDSYLFNRFDLDTVNEIKLIVKALIENYNFNS